MKNLPLQMANTILPKKTSDATSKSNAMLDKFATVESSNSFQMMLTRQVKSQKDSAQKGSILQEKAQKNASLQNNTDLKIVDEKAQIKTRNAQLVAITAAQKQAGSKSEVAKSSHETSESVDTDFLEGLSAKPIEQAVSIEQVLAVEEEVIDSKSEEVFNNPSGLSPTGLTLSFVQAISSPVPNAIASETVLRGAMLPRQDMQAKVGEPSDVKVQENDILATEANKYPSQEKMQQSVANQIDIRQVGDNELSAKLTLNTNQDSAIKELAMTASYQPVAQTNATSPMQQVAPNNNIIQAYPGKAGWDQAISQKVVWMVGASEQSATLTLNPPDLGPLQVVISVKNDMVDTAFMSDNVEVRQALQDGMANLREKLSESGIQLGQASVSSGEQAKQEFQQPPQNRLASQLNSNEAVLAEEKIIITNNKVRLINGLVDTFA